MTIINIYGSGYFQRIKINILLMEKLLIIKLLTTSSIDVDGHEILKIWIDLM